jgi:hypothetical protein
MKGEYARGLDVFSSNASMKYFDTLSDGMPMDDQHEG